MVTTAIVPEKTVSDDHRRDTAKRERPPRRWPGRRDPAGRQRHQEEECDEQASPEVRIQPTRSCSSCQVRSRTVGGSRSSRRVYCLVQDANERPDGASLVQLGATSESLQTKTRDLVGCVTITKELGQRYGLWSRTQRRQSCRCFVGRQSNAKLVHSCGCRLVDWRWRQHRGSSSSTKRARSKQSLKVRETVPSSAGLNWHIATHVIRGSSSRRGREIRHRGFPAFLSRPRERCDIRSD